MNKNTTKATEPCRVELTSRQVIEHKLLMALKDGRTVAILASKQDLEDMIAALRGYKRGEHGNVLLWEACERRKRNLAEGMEQLCREAFPD